MELKPGIFNHEAHSAFCSVCEKPFVDGGQMIFAEPIEAFISRLSIHSWFADHKFVLCPQCVKG